MGTYGFVVRAPYGSFDGLHERFGCEACEALIKGF